MMPRTTNIKLRAGTKAAWAATAKTQTLTGAEVVGSGATTAVLYSATGGTHTLAVGDVVTITGFSVISGNNPYNIEGGEISEIATGTFKILIASGTTGGNSSGTGTATLIVLSTGEAAVETDTNQLKIGDGKTSWDNIKYVNKPITYVVNTNQAIASTTNEQNLLDNRFKLRQSSTYTFELNVLISCATAAARSIKFGFEQTGMTAWSDVRYSWVYGTRINGTTHYATEARTIAGNSPAADSLIQLGPNSDTDEDVIFFTIKGLIRTGAGDSYFQPRIQFTTAAPGTGTTLAAGSYVTLNLEGDSPFVNDWVSN
jgi:hypothetical protein